MKKFLILLSAIILLAGCSIEKLDKNELKERLDANEFSEEYSNIKISNNNPFVYRTANEIIKTIKKGTGIIYFGFPECPWCQQAVPELTRAAGELKIDKIYYFNPKAVRDNNTKEYQEIIKLLNDYLDTDDNGNKRLYVPDVYFISKGKIIGHHSGTFDWQTNPKKQPLNSKQKDELKNIFKELIKETYNIK